LLKITISTTLTGTASFWRDKNSSDEVFPHYVWEKSLTKIKRKIGSASPKSPSDFPNVSQIEFFSSEILGLPKISRKNPTSFNLDVIRKFLKVKIGCSRRVPSEQIVFGFASEILIKRFFLSKQKTRGHLQTEKYLNMGIDI